MRSKIAQRILEDTPQSTRDKVSSYAKQLKTKTMWIDSEKQTPETNKFDWGYASKYVLVKLEDGNIVNARLEGETESNLFWYSPLFDDQIDDVIEWMDIPA